MDVWNEELDHRVLIETSLEDFAESSGNPFKDLEKVSLFEKLLHEKDAKKIIERFMKKIEPFRNLKNRSLTPQEKDGIRVLFLDLAEEMDSRKIFFDEPFLGSFIEMGYLESTESFFSEAERHDSTLEFTDLFQAVRNVWIMNSLQLMFAEKIRMTPSVFSYSMLYPYTDNFLDDPEISLSRKKAFNERLQKVLEGNGPSDASPEEAKIFQMIHNIELQYQRKDYPRVYKSLLMIQDAQVHSLSQNNPKKLSPNVLLPISFYKGGASVLADGFLCKGELTEIEMNFSFGYGAFLQLLDDLQDIECDRKDNHWTLFSIKHQEEIYDKEIVKLLCYIDKVLCKYRLYSPDEEMLKRIIRECTRLMIMDVVGQNPHLVSEKLYKSLESYSKVRLSFFKEYHEKFSDWSSLFTPTADSVE
ncbi:hypothetical protein ACHAL6_04435 [Proteiniclasticum sp. C24MP]|uniref:hypothetical protein n=1 Tax=Proteiniclasticum sp. C24MP TaxID=3374101 RepID=UPI0037552AF7